MKWLPLECQPYAQTYFSWRGWYRDRIEVSGGGGRRAPARGLRPVSGTEGTPAAELESAAATTGIVRLVRADARAPRPHGLPAATGARRVSRTDLRGRGHDRAVQPAAGRLRALAGRGRAKSRARRIQQARES